VDPRAGLDDVEKRKFLTLLGLQLQPLGRPAHSQLLYRLRYPDNIKMYLRDTGCVGVNYIQLVKCRVMVGFCEYGLEPSGSINARNCIMR
jgi:hypothetical protein